MVKAFINGKIYVSANHFEETLLWEDDLILGYDIGDRTIDQVIDLGGRTVIPGFNDSHLHLASVGYLMSICDLTKAQSIKEVIEMGKAFLKEKQVDCLQGRGWNPEQFTEGEKRNLNRYDLDEISREMPIVFTRVCGHLAVGNSKALELLNLRAETAVVEGEILTDSNGVPTGVFTESAVRLLQSLVPPVTNLHRQAFLDKAMRHVVSQGITSVQSCDIMDAEDWGYFEVLRGMKEEKSLIIRYAHQFNFQQLDDFERYLSTEFTQEGYDDKWLSRGVLKLFKDGSLGARTALMTKAYEDSPDTKGVDTLLDSRLKKLCLLADHKGIGVIIHVIGDAALDSALHVFKPLTQNGNPLGHGLVHCQISRPDQLKQICSSDLNVYFQPIFLENDHKIAENRIGSELMKSSYANKTLKDMGVTVAFSTDAPVEPTDPFRNLYYAVTRKKDDGNVFLENQCLTLQEALDAYTYESALVEKKGHIKGRLKPGYYADFAVLNQDIFTLPIEDLLKTQVDMTFVGGERVYKRKSLIG